MTTIDDEIKMIPVLQRQPVGFIKLDIEGAEFRALQGAKNTLIRDSPFVVFENSLATAACSFNYTQAEFFAFFSELGYKIFDVFGTPLTLNRWQGSERSELCWNFVAAHKDDTRLVDFCGCIDHLLSELAALT